MSKWLSLAGLAEPDNAGEYRQAPVAAWITL